MFGKALGRGCNTEQKWEFVHRGKELDAGLVEGQHRAARVTWRAEAGVWGCPKMGARELPQGPFSKK